MKKIFFNLLVLIFLSTSAIAQKEKAPWKTIFNGKNLEGWKIVGEKAVAEVRNGEIMTRRVIGNKEHTFVATEKEYGNFILEMDFKLDAPGYSCGVIIRCIDAIKIPIPDTAKVRLYGYQVKIDDRDRRWTGGVFDDFGGTWHWLYDLSDNENGRKAFKIGEWNTFRIEAIDNNIKVWVNNIPASNLIDNTYEKGYIALKIHAMKAGMKGEELFIHYKNIRIITMNPEEYARKMDLIPRSAL